MRAQKIQKFVDGFYKALVLISALVVSVGALTAIVRVFLPQIQLWGVMVLIAALSYYFSDKVDAEELFTDLDRFMDVNPVQNHVDSAGGLGGRQRRIYTYS